MTTHERELTEPVDLCLPDGTLNPAAVGWSRRPLHRCNLGGPWGRQKRWDYWAVCSREVALGVTYSNLDWLGLVTVALFDLERGVTLEHGAFVPLGRGLRQPETVGGANLRFAGSGLTLAIDQLPARAGPRAGPTQGGEPGAAAREGGVRISARWGDPANRGLEAEIEVHHPPGHETLNVVIPWRASRGELASGDVVSRFQFTSKQNTLPARGWVRSGGRRWELSAETGAYGCLDYGRGLWPYRITWNWASASGTATGADGRAITLGLQLGGKWTDGTGMTENGLCVDGRLHKIGATLDLQYDRGDFKRPWRLATRDDDSVRLTFEPCLEKAMRVPLAVADAELHLCFGHFSGTVKTDEGEPLRVEHMVGWAEEFKARW